jgi:hypothetical protein
VTIRRGGVLPASSPIPNNNLCRPTTALFRRREQIRPMRRSLILSMSSPGARTTHRASSTIRKSLNQQLNELLFDALQLDIVADTAGDPAIRGPETDEIGRRITLRSRRCRYVRRRCTHGLGIVHDSRHGSNAGSADISQRSMVARPAQAGLPHRQ